MYCCGSESIPPGGKCKYTPYTCGMYLKLYNNTLYSVRLKALIYKVLKAIGCKKQENNDN
jgi:hypothetical protein